MKKDKMGRVCSTQNIRIVYEILARKSEGETA
jgi:hypothetical protein